MNAFFLRKGHSNKKKRHVTFTKMSDLCLLNGLHSCQLSVSLLLQCLLYGSVFTCMNADACLLPFACSSFLFCIQRMFSKFPLLWIFSSKVWAYFHTAYQNHLHIKESSSLEKYNGYHLQQYHKEYIHNVLKLRSTGQILLITRTQMM